MDIKEIIVITGAGILSPLGDCKENYWEGLKNSISAIKEITIFDASKYTYQRAGEITAFNPKQYLGEKGLKYLSRTTKLFMSAAFLCVKDAGIKNDQREYLHYDPVSVGIVVGTTYSVLHSTCSFDQIALVEGPEYVSPMAFPNLVMNSHAGYLAIKENIQGLNITVSTGYTSSLDAIGMAPHYLTTDQLKCLIVGGVEELSEEFLLLYLKQGMISENACVGEGCGVYSIEKLSDALARKAKIYGEVSGYGNVFCQNDEGLEKAIELALEDANIDKNKIDWIIKGINIGEREKRIEAKVIENNFGTEIPISDLRSALGDSYSAGGSLQVGAALGLIEQKLAKNILTISIDPCGNCSALIIKYFPG